MKNANDSNADDFSVFIKLKHSTFQSLFSRNVKTYLPVIYVL